MSKKHANVAGFGLEYRAIAEIMTDNGFAMKHSSVRNYVLKIMKKFVVEYSKNIGVTLTDRQIVDAAESPLFQSGIADIIESKKR